jgi:hypothetical protein
MSMCRFDFSAFLRTNLLQGLTFSSTAWSFFVSKTSNRPTRCCLFVAQNLWSICGASSATSCMTQMGGISRRQSAAILRGLGSCSIPTSCPAWPCRFTALFHPSSSVVHLCTLAVDRRARPHNYRAQSSCMFF